MISFEIIIFLFILILIVLSVNNKKYKIVYITSDIDNTKYQVQDHKDKRKAANLLAQIRANIFKLANHLSKNIEKFKENEPYIKQLTSRIYDTKMSEGFGEEGYTSYTINKGDEIVFCLRNENGDLHNINLLMYVVLHEISHVACPEQGHTDLFKKIFAFIVETAISIDVYTKIDFYNNPVRYCGLTISDSIV